MQHNVQHFHALMQPRIVSIFSFSSRKLFNFWVARAQRKSINKNFFVSDWKTHPALNRTQWWWHWHHMSRSLNCYGVEAAIKIDAWTAGKIISSIMHQTLNIFVELMSPIVRCVWVRYANFNIFCSVLAKQSVLGYKSVIVKSGRCGLWLCWN